MSWVITLIQLVNFWLQVNSPIYRIYYKIRAQVIRDLLQNLALNESIMLFKLTSGQSLYLTNFTGNQTLRCGVLYLGKDHFYHAPGIHYYINNYITTKSCYK